MQNLYERIIEQTDKMGMIGKELGNLLGLKKVHLSKYFAFIKLQ